MAGGLAVSSPLTWHVVLRFTGAGRDHVEDLGRTSIRRTVRFLCDSASQLGPCCARHVFVFLLVISFRLYCSGVLALKRSFRLYCSSVLASECWGEKETDSWMLFLKLSGGDMEQIKSLLSHSTKLIWLFQWLKDYFVRCGAKNIQFWCEVSHSTGISKENCNFPTIQT